LWDHEKVWNYYPVSPGEFGVYLQLWGLLQRRSKENPVFVPECVSVMQDSGAFCDGIKSRLDFSGALDRQIFHANKFGYDETITHRASYDLLIDEKMGYRWEKVKRPLEFR